MGLKKRLEDLNNGLLSVADFFSIGMLLKTLFAPFRQISAGVAEGAPVGVRLRMWGDRQLSRFVGAFMRTMLILAGMVVITLRFVYSLVVICFHLAVPILPVIGLVALAMRVVLPWSI